MTVKENDIMDLLKILSNKNYGNVEYTTIESDRKNEYDIYILSCSTKTIEDLLENGFNVCMTHKGLLVYKW